MLWGKITELILYKDPKMFNNRISYIKRRVSERLTKDEERLFSPKNPRRSSQKKKKPDRKASNNKRFTEEIPKEVIEKAEPVIKLNQTAIVEEKSEEDATYRMKRRKSSPYKHSPARMSLKSKSNSPFRGMS